MPAPKKIPDSLLPQIMKMWGEAQQGHKIKKWLANDHGIFVSTHAITQRINAAKKMRAPIEREVLKEELRGVVVEDLKALELLICDAAGIQKRTRDPELKLKAIETQRKLLDLRFSLSGAFPKGGGGDHNVNVNVGVKGGDGNAAPPQVVVMLPEETKT